MFEGGGFFLKESEGEAGAESVAEGFGVLEFEDFEDRLGVVVDGAGVGIVVAHEGFDAAEDGFLGVSEFVGKDALEAEGEDVVPFIVVIEGVADAVEEVEGVLEFLAGGAGEDAFVDEIVERAGVEFGIGEPLEVVEIAEGAW